MVPKDVPLRRPGDLTDELPAGLFRRLLDAAPDAIIIADESGSIVLVNTQVEALFGWPRGELIGRPLDLLIATRLDTMGVSLAARGRRRDGGAFPVEARVSPLEFKGHRLLIVAVQDITERQRSAEALAASQRDYKALVEALDGIVWEADAQTLAFSFVSEQAERLLGYPRDAWYATPGAWAQHLHPADRDAALAFCAAETRAGRDHVFEYRMIAADGRIVWLQDRVTVVSEGGAALRLRGVMVDVTERKRAEQSFRELLEAAPDAMVMADGGGKIVLVNSQTERLFGWNRSDLLGKPIETLIPQRYHAQHVRHRASYAAAPRTRGMGAGLELYGLRADGSEFPIEVSLSPVTTASGVVSMAAIRDITERKRTDEVRRQAERELARRADALARSNAELEQFAYVASHDLQEPLRTVASYTQLLARRQGNDPRSAEYVEFITGGVRQMQVLIEDLLAYSRVTLTGAPPAPVDLNEVMKTVLSNLAGALTETRGEVACEPLPIVPGHAAQLAQLLQNLVGNALKYHGAQPPRVHVGCRREPAGWQFWVADNGIGIDPEHFDKIFVIFQRLHSRERYSGTGIGLALCRKIVTLHGGRIWVESGGAGKGSTFRFTLPERSPES